MYGRGIQEALSITADNMEFVKQGLNSPMGVMNVDAHQTFFRLKMQRDAMRRVAPNITPVLSHLVSIAQRYNAGKMSDDAAFKQCKKIALKYGIDRRFITDTEQFLKANKQAKVRGKPQPIYNLQPFKINNTPFWVSQKPRGRMKPSRKKNHADKLISGLFGGM